jgi:hypothetical protein
VRPDIDGPAVKDHGNVRRDPPLPPPLPHCRRTY